MKPPVLLLPMYYFVFEAFLEGFSTRTDIEFHLFYGVVLLILSLPSCYNNSNSELFYIFFFYHWAVDHICDPFWENLPKRVDKKNFLIYL